MIGLHDTIFEQVGLDRCAQIERGVVADFSKIEFRKECRFKKNPFSYLAAH
jgi:hypothetical protein